MNSKTFHKIMNYCQWIKLNQFYYDTECGLHVVCVREEIKENIYCRKCGKEIKVV